MHVNFVDIKMDSTYRVSKDTCFPTQSLRSHSRAGKAPGSSILPLALDAILDRWERGDNKENEIIIIRFKVKAESYHIGILSQKRA